MKYIAILLIALVSTSSAVQISKKDQPPGTAHIADTDIDSSTPSDNYAYATESNREARNAHHNIGNNILQPGYDKAK